MEVESTEIGQSNEVSWKEYSASVDVSVEKKDKKPGVTLREAKMSPGLRSELCKIRKFYSNELNCNREGTALQNTTRQKVGMNPWISVVFEKNKKILIQPWFIVPIQSW